MRTKHRYNSTIRLALLGAETLAQDHGHLYIEPLHLLRELLEQSESLWNSLRVDRKDLISFVDVRLARLPRRR